MAATNSGMIKMEYGMYFLVYLVVLMTTVLYFVYSDNSKSFSYSTLGFVLMTFFVLGITLYYFYPSLKGQPPNMMVVYLFTIIIFFVFIFSLVGASVDANNLKSLGIVFIVIISAILILALALVFYIFGDYLKQRRGVVGLIINLIFYIPCMVLDFIEYMKREFSLTTRTEYMLLSAETILIICYFFARPIINSALSSNTFYLLKNTIFLNKQVTLLKNTTILGLDKNADLLSQNAEVHYETDATGKHFRKIKPSTKTFSSNFSISLWVYLNIQTDEQLKIGGSLIETNIFTYGKGKPQITYINNPKDNKNRDMYNFYFTNSTAAPNHQTSIPSQKWNNIVFNYSSQGVDLFINGNLETSFPFEDAHSIPTYHEHDRIIVGEDKGLNGAICNIVYTKSNMSNNQIVNNYNILKLKNPPIPQI